MENKSMDDLLCATKELLSLWMTTYPNSTLNNLSIHEIRNITASQRIESIGLKNFEAFFSNTHIGEDYRQNNSAQPFQCKFTPSIFGVNISNVTTSKLQSMTSSLYRSPSLSSAMTPNISFDVQEEIVALHQSAELNSDEAMQIEPGPKLSAISSSSRPGNIPVIYEAAETSPPSIAPKSPLLYSLQKK